MNHNPKTQVLFTLHVHIACEVLKIYNPSEAATIESIADFGIKRGYISKAQSRMLGGMFKHTVPSYVVPHTWWNKTFIQKGIYVLMLYTNVTIALPPMSVPVPSPQILSGSGTEPVDQSEDTQSNKRSDPLSDYDRAMGIVK